MRLAQRKVWLLQWLQLKGYREFNIRDAYLVHDYLQEIGQAGRVKYFKDGSIRCKRMMRDLRALFTEGWLHRLSNGNYALRVFPLPKVFNTKTSHTLTAAKEGQS